MKTSYLFAGIFQHKALDVATEDLEEEEEEEELDEEEQEAEEENEEVRHKIKLNSVVTKL